MTDKEKQAQQDFITYCKAGYDPVWSAVRVVMENRLMRQRKYESAFTNGLIQIVRNLPAGTQLIYM